MNRRLRGRQLSLHPSTTLMLSRLLAPSVALLLTLLLPPSGHSAPPPPDPLQRVPDALRPWAEWVLWEDEHRFCPVPYSDTKTHLCFWPSRLEFTAEATGGRFDCRFTTYHPAWVPLPSGPGGLWPMEVTVAGAVTPVVTHENRPSVHLERGTFQVTGVLPWKSIPQKIALPAEIGILSLKVAGTDGAVSAVENPRWEADGTLWLQRSDSVEETDKDFLGVKLYAALEDGVPLWWRTEVELTIAGQSREVQLGVIVPEGWHVASVESPIPVAIGASGEMKAQVRAGKWTVHVDAFRVDQPQEIRYAPGAKVATAEEFVAFSAAPELRRAEIAGLTPIDVSQISFSDRWRNLPVFRWDTAKTFQLLERWRGRGEQKPPGLRVTRALWLEEDGRELTFRDLLKGEQQQIWRLDTAAGVQLGGVRSDGASQLLTRNAQTGAAGVEVRQRNVNLEAVGRLPRGGAWSASGWATDVDSLNASLNLPPGWRLFALFGADWVEGDWLTSWTLLDLFLLLVFTFAVHRLWGWTAAAVALLGFGLSFHEPRAPHYLWLAVLVPVALLRLAPAGWPGRLVVAAKWLVGAALVLALAAFLAQQVQQALYPQLESVRAEKFTVLSRSLPGSAPAGEDRSTTRRVPGGAAGIRRKLETIVLPKVEFREASVAAALESLRRQSIELDSAPHDKGVPIIFVPTGGVPSASQSQVPIPGLVSVPTAPPGAEPGEARITISLTNVPLGEALRYVTNLAGLKYKVEDDGVRVVALGTPTDVLVTKEWRVPRGFLSSPPQSELMIADPLATRNRDGTVTGGSLEARDYLTASGITFPPGSSAIYLPHLSKLVVRNTQENLDAIDYITERSGTLEPQRIDLQNLEYDPKTRLQQGPAVPEWTWRTVQFGWNGPVAATQQVHPWLISPTLERILTVLRIVLLLALSAIMFGARKWSLPKWPGRRATQVAALLILLTGTGWGQSAAAPDAATLEKLRQRLEKRSDAFPNAAEIPTATVTIAGAKLTIQAEVHVAAECAVPLPGKAATSSPLSVTVDDAPAAALRRDGDYLWIVLQSGVHQVRLEAILAPSRQWSFTAKLRPHQLKVDAPEWTTAGLSATGEPGEEVIFSRQQPEVQKASEYERQELQPILLVQRDVELGIVWQVHTRVSRLTPFGRAAVLRVPLLPGESVLREGVMVKDGAVEVRLGEQEREYTWQSRLTVTNTLRLSTGAEDTWVERWFLFASPVWNVTFSGPPAIFEAERTDLAPHWQPWPGEALELKISRPEAVPGATMAVRRATQAVSLGQRQRTTTLALDIACTVGGDFALALPPETEVTEFRSNGTSMPARVESGQLTIPLRVGEQSMTVVWRTNVPLTPWSRVDEVRLPAETANIQTTISVPENRWVLFARGPLRGLAVRFGAFSFARCSPRLCWRGSLLRRCGQGSGCCWPLV